MTDQPDPDSLPPLRSQRSLAARSARRWRAGALALAALLALSWLWMVNREPEPAQASAGAAAAVQAVDNPSAQQYESEQAKSEIRLLKAALDAAQQVDAHHRHHSQVMWDLLQGKISSKEAWWQGGDSTCAGWLAANEFEEAVGKLKGREVEGQPIPKQGLQFCKQARERK